MTNTLKCDMCGADAGDGPYHATIDENGHVHICDGCFYPEHYDLGVLWRERESILAKLNSSERRLDEVTTFCATIERQRDELLQALRGLRDAFLGTSVEVQADAMRAARAAIAKAGGES